MTAQNPSKDDESASKPINTGSEQMAIFPWNWAHYQVVKYYHHCDMKCNRLYSYFLIHIYKAFVKVKILIEYPLEEKAYTICHTKHLQMIFSAKIIVKPRTWIQNCESNFIGELVMFKDKSRKGATYKTKVMNRVLF